MEKALGCKYRSKRSTLEREQHNPACSVFPKIWMVTFSDLLMLLLCFFVLRLSMLSLSAPETPQSTAQPESQVSAKPNDSNLMSKLTDTSIQPNMVQLLSALEGLLGTPIYTDPNGRLLKFAKTVEVLTESEGTRIRLKAETFVPGSDELSFAGQALVQGIARTIADAPKRLIIDAHVGSDMSLKTPFQSEWELSAARALVVTRQMIDAGVDAQAISIMGYGSSKPVENAANSKSVYRNQRLEIFFPAGSPSLGEV